ncbi:DUF1205 domain-containing protein [Streptacidiphilus sp. ASG 303]|uniref:nucleotide disphospho-sugar-binding domain-containing protein n=1 Tax=Streptacidiphilus sp. ASG 303 TaxID=2896847 RepID=UPI001E2B0A00|nr:nucleotide disphospho-sugar-binding domain-containing protein [Streptacidiphilus sp. ASG 303]MCD0485140.1 DUF1205 domain-containing protein [Streptacidiphilus sp. ASG 303]
MTPPTAPARRDTPPRVLFATWSAPSHLYPMVPLAWACQGAGYDVRVAAPPPCGESVARAGLTAVPVGREVAVSRMASQPRLAAWRSPGEWPAGWSAHPELLDEEQREVVSALRDKQIAVAEAMVDDLVAFGRWWRPDVVVHDSLCLAGPVAAAVLGVPAAAHVAGSPAVMRIECGDLAGDPHPDYLRLFERFGTAPRPDPRYWIDPCPPGLRLPFRGERTPMRFVPYNGPGVSPEWLTRPAERPRVCVTGGAAGSKYGAGAISGLFRGVLEAVAGLGAEPVLAVTRAQREALGALPPETRVVESLPFRMLFPACRAVVHHGGSGTSLTALAAGLPQLVLPQAPVLAELARSVEGQGAGLVLDAAGQQDPALLRGAVAALLDDPGPADGAARIGREIAGMPAPASLVPLLADG